MSLWIKICGLTTVEAVGAAVEAGVDAIGFVFAESKRRVRPDQAATIAAAAPAHVARVAVMLHPEQQHLDEVLQVFRPDVLQTDAGDFAALSVPDSLVRLPVLRSGGPLPTRLPVRVLYEGAHSGTGSTADWTEARALSQRTELVLAGGLDAVNVAAAIAKVRPFGVDVSSGVEAAPGVKCPARIIEFVAAARSAAARLNGGDNG